MTFPNVSLTGKGVASIIGGFVIAEIGKRWTFRVLSILSFLSALVYALVYYSFASKRRKIKEGKETCLKFLIDGLAL